MSTLKLKIITPEKVAFEDDVNMVTVPSAQGEMGILPHHIDVMAKVIPGELKIKKGEKLSYLAVGNGFLQISNNIVTLLSDLAEDAASIDEKAVEEAKKRAEKALEEKLSDEEYAETFAALERALAQLKVKRRRRNI